MIERTTGIPFPSDPEELTPDILTAALAARTPGVVVEQVVKLDLKGRAQVAAEFARRYSSG